MLLAFAPDHVAKTVLDDAHLRSFARAEAIFLQSAGTSAIYIVVEGWVRLYRMAPSGAEAVAFRHDTYPVAAEAVTDCTLLRIEAVVLLHQIRENPEVAIAILSANFALLHNLAAQVEALKAQTGAQRVAEFLPERAPCKDGACKVAPPYDKVLIAGRLGMKPESLSRAFARQNVAQIDGVAVLRDYVEEYSALAWTR